MSNHVQKKHLIDYLLKEDVKVYVILEALPLDGICALDVGGLYLLRLRCCALANIKRLRAPIPSTPKRQVRANARSRFRAQPSFATLCLSCAGMFFNTPETLDKARTRHFRLAGLTYVGLRPDRPIP